MATKKPLVLYSGDIKELAATDTLDASTTDGDYVSATNANASPITLGMIVYQTSTTGEVDLAQADASGTAHAFGMVADSSISAAASGMIIVDGLITASTGEWDALTGGSGGLTPGAVYYLSGATAGSMTTTAPSTSSHWVLQVGVAHSTTEFLFQPKIRIGIA